MHVILVTSPENSKQQNDEIT